MAKGEKTGPQKYTKRIPANKDEPANENISYSYKEALVHKICNLSPFLPKTYNVEIKDEGTQLIIEMEKMETQLKNPSTDNKIKAWKNILQAVALLNFFGIAHRDIKDENILYRDGEEAVLIDFGLSKALLGGFHTPKIVSDFYRAPELDTDLNVQKYGFEVDSWSLGIWALELWNVKFDSLKYVPIWKIANGFGRNLSEERIAKAQLQIREYLENVPKKIQNVVESFLLPGDRRKTALDWVKIDSSKFLFSFPENWSCPPIPSEYAEWSIGYKSIYWSIQRYFSQDKNASIQNTKIYEAYTIWACSLLLFPFEVDIVDLARTYGSTETIIYSKVLEWFISWKVLSKKDM
uniref:Protein kinase domain-containing protein n=1 Tax=viral metagenome TaxID=1070528 RepID=A0A6C0JVQ1_9ZZZZ